MKTKKLNFINRSVLITAIGVISLTSCQDDKMLEADDANPAASQNARTGTLFNARLFNLPQQDIYLFPEDQNYEMIDMGRYALGNVIKDMITEENLGQIVNYARNTGEKHVTFEKIFSFMPHLKDQIDSKLATQTLPDCPYNFSSYDHIASVMSRNGIDYSLGLYIYNLDNNPGTGTFILTPGTELDDETDIEDQVMAWYKDPSTLTPTPIKISETEAKTFSTIGTFTSIGLSPTSPVITGPGGPPPAPGPQPLAKINIRQVNLHHRYEKHGKSEVYIHAINKTSSTTWNPLFGSNWPANDRSKHLTSTKKTWEWVTVDKGQYLYQGNVSAVWNTFERDWWEPFKQINSISGLSYMDNAIPMTFADEWYGIYPVNNNLTHNKSMGPLKSPIVTNGGNNTYVQGDWNKFEAHFYAN